jgi:DeoR family transcriptional regulator of aga operon
VAKVNGQHELLKKPSRLWLAQAAAGLVATGESILVDVGTTAAAFATQLVARPDLGELNVITNGISIALALEAAHPRFSIVVTGGTLRPKQHSLVDPLAASMLQSLNVDTVFLGCNGIHPETGVTNINLPEAAIKRTMIEAANRCVVLADSTKLGVRTLAQVCDISDIDVVVTDSGADEQHLSSLRSQGVDVIVC